MANGDPTPDVGSGSVDIYAKAYSEGFNVGDDWARQFSPDPPAIPVVPPPQTDQHFETQAQRHIDAGFTEKYKNAYEAGLKAGYEDRKRILNNIVNPG